MIFYFVIYLIATGLAFISDWLEERSATIAAIKSTGQNAERPSLLSAFSLANVTFALSGMVLLAVRGLRCGVGIDYFLSYVPKFRMALEGQQISWGDPLYNGFIQLCAAVSSDYRVFFFIDTLLFIGIIYAAIALSGLRRGPCVALLCFTYHFARSFIFQAQYLAMACCLLGVVLYAFQRKRVLSVLCLLIAVGLHSSAIIMVAPLLTMVIVERLGVRLKIVAFAMILIPIAAILIRPFLESIVQAVLSERFSGYFGSSHDDNQFSGYLFVVNLAVYLFTLTVLLRQKKHEVSCCYLALIQAFSLAASILTGTVPLAYRLVFYFMFSQVLLVPLLSDYISKRKVKICVEWGIILCFAAVQFVYLLPQDTDGVIPYCSIFSSEEQIKAIEEGIDQYR